MSFNPDASNGGARWLTLRYVLWEIEIEDNPVRRADESRIRHSKFLDF